MHFLLQAILWLSIGYAIGRLHAVYKFLSRGDINYENRDTFLVGESSGRNRHKMATFSLSALSRVLSKNNKGHRADRNKKESRPD